ncbi:beta-ketoacyl-ACP synthase II [Clostridium sp.]|uniref:beta-ketoacyl-ACP synthase II n=1 Tax=Clostridium sp. TaxID=1506 RepID=UPI003216E49F
MDKRVVITGMGAVTPIGNDVNSFWNGIKEGQCGIDFIKSMDVEKFKVKIAAEVKNFNPDIVLDKKESKRMDKYCQFAMVAADEAVKSSKLKLEEVDSYRLGVLVSSGIGGLQILEHEYRRMIEKDTTKVSPFLIPMMIGNIAAGNIAIKYDAKGPCMSIVTACATGTNSIGEGFEMIRANRADVIIAGGAEASISQTGVAGFTSLTALSKSEDPKRASIPFDKNRSGFVMGEGAGVVILEELEHAKARGAKIYGEVVGYGSTCDAYHITSPSPDGEGASRSMKLAIEQGNIRLEDVSYINAHGTSTPYNDKFETIAIKNLFKEVAYNIPVSSTKSMTGHLLGASGAIESIVCIKALEEGFVPPTVGLEEKDEDCDLDYVANVGRKAELKYALSNSLGFGGHNATLLFKKWEE